MMLHPLRAMLFLLAFVLVGSAQVLADSGQEPIDFHDTFNPTAFIQELGAVYEGEIEGRGKVVVQLGLSPKKAGQFSGRYFLAHDGRDIPLEGPWEALAEPEALQGEKGSPSHGGFDRPRAIWNIREQSGGNLTGEWADRHTGESHPFRLREVYLKGVIRSLGFEVNDADKLPDPYRLLQIRAVARPVGEEVVKGQTAYRMWEDPRTGMRYPRLTRHPDPKVMARINFLLEEKHGRFAPEMLWAQGGECEDAFAKGEGQVTYLSGALMSMVETGAFAFCAGEFYPYSHPVTFDLLRGEYLDWNRLADFFVPGRDENGKIRPQPSPAFRQWYARQEQELRESAPDRQDGLLAAAFWDVYLDESDTDRTLVLMSPYRCCTLQHTDSLPLSRLTPLLKPEGRRYFLPAGAAPTEP
ncbi:MAG: hypothetical protein LBO79_07285 [Zoogloeaceae bacterium]|jgi:hypothetical protein|nr:hypothetical protein [Zoogloeaceae bacterium]